METLLPSIQDAAQVNRQREQLANLMADQSPDAPMLVMEGPCSADSNRLPNGELSTFVHLRGLHRAAQHVRGVELVGRYVGAKPRSNTGPTGLLHQPEGPEVYAQGANRLHLVGLPLASEILDESDAALALPHLSIAWIGARNVADTGPRYLVRPTTEEIDSGAHPIPILVKNSQEGDLDAAVNAIRTIMSEEPETRTRLTLGGLQRVTTHANPHVGLILRGGDRRPDGPLDKVLADEIVEAQDRLEAEFHGKKIPIIVDLAHAHAKWEGGGQDGQMAILQGLGEAMLGGVRIDGIMAESYIVAGRQPCDGKEPGLSTTDPCMDQAHAVQVIEIASQMHSARRIPVLA